MDLYVFIEKHLECKRVMNMLNRLKGYFQGHSIESACRVIPSAGLHRAAEYYVPFLVILFALIWMIAHGQKFEVWGDALARWNFVRAVLYRGDAIASGLFPGHAHHALRWGGNIPLAVFMRIFGPQQFTYFMATYSIACFFALCIYFIGRLYLKSISGGIICVLFAICCEFNQRNLSQILPSGQVICYFSAAILFLKLWEEKRCRLFLAAASFFIFIAYGSKVTAIYIFPAIILNITLISSDYNIKNAFSKKILLDLASFISVFAFGIFIETILLYGVTNWQYPWGRLLYLQSSVGEFLRNDPRLKFENIFDIVKSLHISMNGFLYHAQYVLAISLFTSILIIIFRIRKYLFLAMAVVSIFFFQSFFIKSINPLTLAEIRLMRYYVPVINISLLLMVFLSYELFKFLISHSKEIFRIAGVFVALFLIYGFNLLSSSSEWPDFRSVSIVKSYHDQILVDAAIANEMPIVAEFLDASGFPDNSRELNVESVDAMNERMMLPIASIEDNVFKLEQGHRHGNLTHIADVLYWLFHDALTSKRQWPHIEHPVKKAIIYYSKEKKVFLVTIIPGKHDKLVLSLDPTRFAAKFTWPKPPAKVINIEDNGFELLGELPVQEADISYILEIMG